ncbi:hypothetical protein [Raoultella ornithinolytica]|uniref:hypothetical protein n=1 Tax=Raoultella ornithinolytica TaxID=54291 RepID=UPI0010539CFF
MKKLLACLSLILFISACNENGSSDGGSDSALTMFKAAMNEGDHPPFIYKNLVFKPDQQNSSKVISGWVCGDASMKRNDKTFEFKVRGHVIKTKDVSYVGDIAGLLDESEMVKYDLLYNKYCKE